MLDYLKETPIKDVIDLYYTNHGFVFLCNYEVAESSVEKLVAEIKKHDISKENPVLVAPVEGGFLFVYDDFDSPTFFRVAGNCCMFCEAEITPLHLYLKRIKETSV